MSAGSGSKRSSVVIAGAGPAGSSLAIRLARLGMSVTVIERTRFPRQKLCGEFISPECLDHFSELGVHEQMVTAGGDRIEETVFFSLRGRSASVPSGWFGPQNALGLSRAEMDHLLLQKAKDAGALVVEGVSVTGADFEDGAARTVRVRTGEGTHEEISADLFVDATGRHRALARHAPGGEGTRSKPSIVGFKAHMSGTALDKGRCEIYFFPGGYAGLNYVEGGVANHCFLVKAEAARALGSNADDIVEQLVMKNARARETLSGANKVYDWLAVAVERFGPAETAPAPNMFAVGDAGAFIDPFTGSGMLMALESSKLLADVLGEDLRNGKSAQEYRKAHRARFRRRLQICAAMRRLAYSPAFAEVAVAAAGTSSVLRRLLARNTRKGTRVRGT